MRKTLGVRCEDKKKVRKGKIKKECYIHCKGNVWKNEGKNKEWNEK